MSSQITKLTPEQLAQQSMWEASKALDDAERSLRWARRPDLLRQVSEARVEVMQAIAKEGFANPLFGDL